MRKRHSISFLLISLVLFCLNICPAWAGAKLISETGVFKSIYTMDLSANGKYMVYMMNRTLDGVYRTDVVLSDIINNDFTVISKNKSGQLANGKSVFAAISGDGRYIAFSSTASDLVDGDTNGKNDVFLYDRISKTITKISKASDGSESNGDSLKPSISQDGSLITYTSSASNIVNNDTNNCNDIFIYNTNSNTTTRIKAYNNQEPNGSCNQAAISADNKYIAFTSTATNLTSKTVAGNISNIYLLNTSTGSISLVSKSSKAESSNQGCFTPAISADGQYIAFESAATNLTTNETDSFADIFLVDTNTGDIQKVSVSSNGAAGNAASNLPSISSDGRYVCFKSTASNLVSGDTNKTDDAFVYDTSTKTTTRVSYDTNDQENTNTLSACDISADASCVAYAMYAPYSSPIVSDCMNVYLRDITEDLQLTTFKVVSVSPNNVTASSDIQVTVYGQGFDKNVTMKLIKSGIEDVIGTVKSVSDNGQSAVVTFDLSERPAGSYSIKATNPDNTSATGINLLNVEAIFKITKAEPTSAPNTACILVTLYGSGLDNNCVAVLQKTGQTDIQPISQNHYVDSKKLELSFDLRGKLPGFWTLKVTKQGSPTSPQILDFFVSNGMNVSSILPPSGSYLAPVTVSLLGNGFVHGSRLTLSKLGYSDIAGENSSTAGTLDKVTSILDITEKPEGIWNLNLVDPGGNKTIVSESFSIEKPNPDILVSVEAPDVWRTTRGPSSINIVVKNLGNLDARGNLAIQGIPLSATWDITSPAPPTINGVVSSWKDILEVHQDNGNQIIIFPRISIQAATESTYTLKLQLTQDTNVTLTGIFVGT